MKNYLKVFLLFLCPLISDGQDEIESLRSVFRSNAADSLRFDAALSISTFYRSTEWKWDSAVHYANEAVSIAKDNHQKISEAVALIEKGRNLQELGDFASALQDYLHAFEILKDPVSETRQDWILWQNRTRTYLRLRDLSYVQHMYGTLMQRTGDETQAIFHFLESARLAKRIGHEDLAVSSYSNAGRLYVKANKLDSAIYCLNEAESSRIETSKFVIRTLAILKGDIYREQLQDSLALREYYAGLQNILHDSDWRQSPSNFYLRLGNYHYSKANSDSAVYYAKKNLESIQAAPKSYRVENNLGDAYENLYRCFLLSGQQDSAYKYQGVALAVKDSLYKLQVKNLSAFQQKNLHEKLRLQNVEKEKIAYQNMIRTWFLLAGIGVLLLLAIIFYLNNRQKHKAKLKIERAYEELKTTQQQLIQSEKMASLGELTAGIAHEIQNPLNFVNNFSEVNKEMLVEMNAEIEKGNYQDVKAIAKDITDNEEKINHHGKRAEGIVKNMLQHSRSSSGKKEPTDINALCDEYLRLAYHGLRAKDKSFNANFKADFDNSIGSINVVPQDIGRVILNLINNAFYAVDEKKKQQPNFEPIVTVITRSVKPPSGGLGAKVEIKVSDNGNGIPQKVLDKIFQPFFTTKPTGQGTGLGLSLSYDIIKAHGGEITVNTNVGEYTEFILRLPS